MFWRLLLGYVICSQLIVAFWVWMSGDCEDDDSQMGHCEEERTPTAAFLLMMASAPFLLPWMIYAVVCWVRQARAEWRELGGTFHPVVLNPLHEINLPEALAEYIHEHASAAEAAEFESLGEYWLKEQPINSKARIFWNEDTFAEIGITLTTTLYCETISYLEDGTMISSANCEPIARFAKFEKFGVHVNAIEDANMADLIESHRRFVEKVSIQVESPVQSIPREAWKDFYRYHNQKFGMAKFQLGELTEPPTIDLKFPIQKEPALV